MSDIPSHPTAPSVLLTRLQGSGFVRFLLGGVVTYLTTVSLMAFWLVLVGVPRLPAYALTHATAFGVAFVLNRRWVFRATAGKTARQGVRFALAQIVFRALDWCIFSLLAVLFLPPVPVGVLAANLLVLPLKYVSYKRHVFPEGGPQEAVPAGTMTQSR